MLIPDETILLVDHEDKVRALAAAYLRAEGFHVLEAMNGVRALDVAAAHAGPIDVVVADLAVPGLDGLRLLRKFRGWYPGMPFVLTSSGTPGPNALAVVDRRRTKLLLKPYAAGELGATVRSLLERRVAGHRETPVHSSVVPCIALGAAAPVPA